MLQEDLDRVALWSHANDLPFNITKCFQLSFHRCRDVINSSYNISNNQLEVIFEYFDLGVVFDFKMTFTCHLNYIIPKSYSMLYFIRRNISAFSDPYTKKVLYSSFVRSRLEYASFIWNPVAATHSTRVEKIQKSFLKFALNSLEFTVPIPSYGSRCLLITLKTLVARRNIASIMFLYGIISGAVDCPELLSLIRFNAPSRSLRQFYTFNIETHLTNYALNEPINRSMILFNSVCYHIDLSFPKCKFKKLLLNLID